MKENKLIAILKTFSKEEMKNFGLFISSPYFNRERDFNPLYLILKKYHPEYPPEKLSDEKLFIKLYPGEKYDNKKSSLNIRVLFSQLTKLAKKFMVYDLYESGQLSIDFNDKLAKKLRAKKLYTEALKIFLENSEQIDKGDKTTEYYNQRLNANISLSNIHMEINKESDCSEYQKNSLLYFYALIFEELRRFLHNGFTLKYNYNIDFKGFNLIESFVKGFDLELFKNECDDDGFETKNRTIFCYFIIKSWLDENNINSLLLAMNIYLKMFFKLDHNLKMVYFTILFNRFEGRQHLNRIYIVKANELVDFLLGNGIFNMKNQKYMAPGIYRDTLHFKATVLPVKKFEAFINNFSEKVPPDYIHDIKNYSMGFLYFKQRHFDKCLEYISLSDSLENIYKVSIYKLKICSLYELGLYEDAIYASDAYERFIKRAKDIGPVLKKDGMELIKGVKSLIQLMQGNGRSINLNEIKEINKNTLFGDWLSEKAAELKKN